MRCPMFPANEEKRELKRNEPEQRHAVRSLCRACLHAIPLLLAGATVGSAALGAGTAWAAVPLQWSSPTSVDAGQSPSAIACPSEQLCAAVDRTGHVLHTTDPAATGSWSKPAKLTSSPLTALACPSASLCVTVDEGGEGFASASPAGSTSGWHEANIHGTAPLTGVSCPSSNLCVAIDKSGDTWTSTDPSASSPTWRKAEIDPGQELKAISCPSETLCVAVDAAGRALTSTDPTAGSPGWQTRSIGQVGEPVVAISCPTAGLCVALDSAGDALASGDPGAANPTWSSTEIDLAGEPATVSCATSGLCVTLDPAGGALASDSPTAAIPAWSGSTGDPGAAPTGISCLPAGLCVAIDTSGRVLTALVPAPAVTSTAAVEVSSGEATLTGTVDPRDAALRECRFEYGPTVAYGQSVVCTAMPSPAGGPQTVSARISELAAASAYHFRILAVSAGGTSAGADETLTTAKPLSIVQPHPSISGVPGIGERLYCNTGVSSDVTVTITYVWVRDTTAIAHATNSSYVVQSADAKHHLQCRVTATDSAGSATVGSGFVAVPATGVLAAAGETKVAKLLSSGAIVSVPVTCSSQAPGGCSISVRITIAQTRPRKPVRHVTVTLASVTVHMKRGERRTIRLVLNAAGRRLLAHKRRLAVKVSVNGTVIGALEASLATATLTLRASSGSGH
jgi:hypothetical protein